MKSTQAAVVPTDVMSVVLANRPNGSQAGRLSFAISKGSYAVQTWPARADSRTIAAGELRHGPVTVMFTDIVGSTEITERLGDRAALALFREHDDIIRRELALHGGVELKQLGDGFMLAFASATEAVECAMAIQHSMAVHNSGAVEPVQVRCGLSAGEVLWNGDDLFGRTVIVAARIVGQTLGGQILVSSLVKALVVGASEIRFGEKRNVMLRGLAGTQSVYDVDWKRPSEETAIWIETFGIENGGTPATISPRQPLAVLTGRSEANVYSGSGAAAL